MLAGPFQLNEVALHVNGVSPGVYILSRDGRTAAYVGRSDTDVAGRIQGSAREGPGYVFFWFQWASSSQDAYRSECEYYHRYNPPDNTVHPAVPLGANWRCPVVGCPWS